MLTLPKTIIHILRQFEEAFSERVWEWSKVLLIGAFLVPGERTVASILRVMRCSDEKQFQNYHRVLNHAQWSSRELSRRLLMLLVRLFVPATAPVILGIDETIERRRGRKIAARDVYRDPVRSSKEFFVKTNGLRWICLMLLTPIPWALRVWALPFLTVLAPSKRYHAERHSKGNGNPSWPSGCTIQTPSGRNRRCPGMQEQHARWNLRRALPSGINLPFHRLQSVGCSFVIHKENMSRWPCCVLIKTQRQSRLSPGLSCAGRWKSPFIRCVLIWV
jgi:hypothetical protein